MKKTYRLKLSYAKTFGLHNLTSLVESVKGVRIQHLSFVSRGADVAGVLIFEASDRLKFQSVLRLIRSKHEVLVEDDRCWA